MIQSSLVIVSNRQPYRHEFADTDGSVVVDRPCGGLVGGLDTVARRLDATWIAWGDGGADRFVSDQSGCVEVPPDNPAYRLIRVWLDEADVHGYYEGYANRVLWPLCHYRTGPYQYDESDWHHYRDVNRRFARKISETSGDGDTVWFQDYHFALAPALVRDRHHGALVHFWHIPWPSPDVLRFCPQRRELLYGLLGNDLIGFHVDRYVEQFLSCVETFVPDVSVDHQERRIWVDGRAVRVDAFPLGVDVDAIRSAAASEPAIEQDLRGRIVLGVDRLDYTKGIPERLRAIEELLERRPDMHGDWTYVQKATESRGGIPEYRQLQETTRSIIARINAQYATPAWQPIVLIDQYLPNETLYGLYRAADVMLVTPICDGMNLVAQEYVAAQRDGDGVLVLSECAGVHEYLGEDALSVNPFDIPALSDSIERALHLPPRERKSRMENLSERVALLDIDGWAKDMLEASERFGVVAGRAPRQ